MYEQKILKDLISSWIIEFGYKAAAQKLFRLLHLFPTPLLVFPHGTKLDVIERAISSGDFLGKNLVIRFSRPSYYSVKNQINAPRLLSSSKEEGLAFISHHWDSEIDAKSSVIIQPEIDVAYSYELYLDHYRAIVEIIPGLWELDNKEPVDRIVMAKQGATLQRYTLKRRSLEFIGPEKHYQDEAPFTFEFLTKRYFRVLNILPLLYLVQHCLNLGLVNFHFLEDRQTRFHFLNARSYKEALKEDSEHMGQGLSEDHETYKVSSLQDVQEWDGKKPIIFDVSADRDKSTEVIECIESLVGKVYEVYVKNGLLSHTAILLREYGFRVRQHMADFETRVIESENIIFGCKDIHK
jgi:hypothetical protein